MNLKELIEKATPIPWELGAKPLTGHLYLTEETRPRYAQSAIGMIERSDADHRLMQHAVNCLPELVEALEELTDRCHCCGGSGREYETIEDDTPCQACGKARSLLAKANTININQKGK